MKVCKVCEQSCETREGDNTCSVCKKAKNLKDRREKAKATRQLMKDMGLVRVRGALGGVYYE